MPEPRADAFISPWISQVAALFTSGRLTPEEMAKPYMAQWPRLPPELLPFVQSLNLSTLAQVLKAHPMLYWHPLVSRQIAYLQRLRHDEANGSVWDGNPNGMKSMGLSGHRRRCVVLPGS